MGSLLRRACDPEREQGRLAGGWGLPGGRLEIGETPQECVAREFLEQLNPTVEGGPSLDALVYEPLPGLGGEAPAGVCGPQKRSVAAHRRLVADGVGRFRR